MESRKVCISVSPSVAGNLDTSYINALSSIIIREALMNESDRGPRSRINLSLVTRSPAEILLVYLDLDTMDTTLAYLILRTLRTQRKYER